MRTRDRTGLALAPLFLRLALAITFIWAGLGKFLDRFEVEGQQAAILANYGVIPNPNAPRRETPPPEDTQAQPENDADAELAPDPTDIPTDKIIDEPTNNPEALAEPENRATLTNRVPPANRVPLDKVQCQTARLTADAPTPRTGLRPVAPIHLVSSRLVAWQDDTQPQFLATAADFPDSVSVRRYAGLVLLLHGAINPGLSSEDSSPLMPLWPDIDPDTDYDHWPRYLALAAALTELIAGILLAIGLLTRLGAISLAGVMLGAIWLTTIGPAIQSGNTVLGILPNHPAFDTAAWATPMWQFSLLCTAMALFFTGPGTLSLDRLLLGGPPKPPPPKPGPKPHGKK